MVSRSFGTRSAVTLFCAAGLLALASCSLIVTSDRCKTDADCTSLSAGAVCRSGACIASGATSNEGGVVGDCTTNAECVARLGDDYAVCEKSRLTCTKLLSTDCTKVVGDYKNDNAIYVGTMFKQGDSAGDLGASPDAIAAIELAFTEFKNAKGGLPTPGGGNARPLVAVECNQTQDYVRAAKHLSEDVRVPAIIGASTTYVTIQAATQVTISDGTFLISPFASSPGLSTLDDKNLVWRTYPSDGLQAQAWTKMVDEIVNTPAFKTPRPTRVNKYKVAVVYKQDTYGEGLRDIILQRLTLNGKSAADSQDDGTLKTFPYPNTDDPANAAYDFSRLIGDVVGESVPFDIVMLLGTSEIITAFSSIESNWPDSILPYYLMPDGIASAPKLGIQIDKIVQGGTTTSKDLRKRIRGTIVNVFSGTVFDAFKLKFAPGNAINGSNAYDAAYTLAYAMYGVGTAPLTGANIATAMAKLNAAGGSSVAVGPNDINTALQGVASNGITLTGTAGKLDFDLTTGDVKATGGAVWCLGVDATGAPNLVTNTGETYDSNADKLVGTFPDGSGTDPCKFN